MRAARGIESHEDFIKNGFTKELVKDSKAFKLLVTFMIDQIDYNAARKLIKAMKEAKS